jgi:hypothetical protein
LDGGAVVSARARRRYVVCGLVLTLAFLSGGLPLTRAAAQSPAPGSSSTAQADAWLVDERGREYRVERIDKKRPHARVDGNRLRLLFGHTVDLAGEDENSFLIKVYRDTGSPDFATPLPAKKMTPEDQARIAASYEFDLRPSQTISFEPFDQGLPRAGQWRYGFALADMNGDGHLDIVHGPPRRAGGIPVVFLGDGAGRWRRWQASFPPQRYDYGHVAVADFNKDGHLDLALGMHLLGMTVLLGDGTGRFKTGSQGMDPVDPRKAFSSHALVAVDWDRDGHLDLVGLAEGPRMGARRGSGEVTSSMGLVLYRNRGDGTWEKKVGTQPLAGDTLVLAESRWDGDPWLVASSITHEQSDLVVRPGDPFKVEPLSTLRPGATVRAVALADFDGDGHEDVAVGYGAHEGGRWRSGVDLILRRPGGTVERRTVFVRDGPQGITALGTGDLDGDGRPDLVALSGDGEILVLRNSGGAVFTREDVQLTERMTGCRGYHVQVRDLDRDGRADIVAAFAGEPEGVGTNRTQGCPGEGSLRAWRSRPRS